MARPHARSRQKRKRVSGAIGNCDCHGGNDADADGGEGVVISKGSNTTTTTQSPTALPAYQQAIGQLQSVAQNPYNPYTGELVAGVNQQQNTGIGNINQYATAGVPYLQTAAGLQEGAANPLTQQQIQQYQSPYTQDVVNATEAQFNNQNAIQQQQVLGNAAAQGALGGDRTAVAQAVLAGQQQTQEAPVIAGLENQGYTQALQTAGQQFQQNPEQAAYGIASTGQGLENAALTGANAQVGAGTLEQQTQQAQDTAAYQQFMQQQFMPESMLSWELPLLTGVGSQEGGTSQTTAPAPNQTAQYAGLGLAALGMFANRGGRVQGLQSGGVPNMGGFTPGALPGNPWLPSSQMPRGVGAPPPPKVPGQVVQTPQQMADQATKLAKGIGGAGPGLDNLFGQSATYGGGDILSGDVSGGSASAPLAGLDASDYEAGSAGSFVSGGLFSNRGGRIQLKRGGVPVRAGLGMASFMPRRKFADGGGDDSGDDAVNFPSDRFVQPSVPAGLYNNSSGEANPLENILKFQTYGLNSPYVPQRTASASVSGSVPDQGDDDSLPPQITGRPTQQEGLGTSAMSFAPQDGSRNAPPVAPPDSVNAAPAQAPQSAADTEKYGLHFGFGLASPDAKSALLAAGLGMLASRSPFLGTAIGEGGLQGLQTYGGLKKQEQDVDLKVRQLDQAAKAEQDRIAEQAKALGETSRHNLATEQYQSSFKQFEEGKPQTMFDQNTGTVRAYQRDPVGVWRWLDTGQPMVGVGNPSGQPAGSPSSGVPTSSNNPPTSTGQPQVTAAAFTSADGFRVQNAKAVAAGQPYNYSSGAPYIEGGMDVPEPSSVAGKSPSSLKTDAEYYLQTGKFPAGVAVRAGNSPLAMAQNAYANAVKNYATSLAASRNITPEQTADMWRTAPGMLRFVMGADGRATVSLGTAMRHLDLLNQLGAAWGAGDNQTINRVRAAISREFGNDAATNLSTASQIIGPEIIKAIGIAGGGGEGERQAAAAWANPISSPAQLSGAVKVTQGLLAGQLEGKRNQAAAAGVDEQRFKNLIGDRPYEILSNVAKGAPGGAATAPALPAGVPTGSVHGTSRTQGPGWQTPDGRFVPDKI